MTRIRMPYRLVALAMCLSVTLAGCPRRTPCPEPKFRDIVTAGDVTRVCVNMGEYMILAYVVADVLFDDDSNASGSVVVMFEDNTEVEIAFNGQEVTVEAGDTFIDLLTTDPDLGDMVAVNDKVVLTDTLLATFKEEFMETDVAGDWSETTQAIAALSVLSGMESWIINVESARLLSISGFMCKVSCIQFGAAVAIVLTAGCGALLAGCTGASVVTLGGVTIPCVTATAICAGGVFAGTTAAYEAWIELVWTA